MRPSASVCPASAKGVPRKLTATWNCLLEAACAISLLVCQSLWFGPFMHLKLLRWNDCVPGEPGKSVCFPSRNVVLVLSSRPRKAAELCRSHSSSRDQLHIWEAKIKSSLELPCSPGLAAAAFLMKPCHAAARCFSSKASFQAEFFYHFSPFSSLSTSSIK